MSTKLSVLNKHSFRAVVFGFTLLLFSLCPVLRAQTPAITAYAESHTRKDGTDTAGKNQAWQTVDLDAVPAGQHPVLGWRQWGRQDKTFTHYDGLETVSRGAGSSEISDLLSYDVANTYVGTDSFFFVSYKDPKTGVAVKDSRNFVFGYDSLAFTVPASAAPKLLRLWTGVYACDGELDADLVSPAGDVLVSYRKTLTCPAPTADPNSNFFYGYWRVRFQSAGPGDTLRVRWQSLNHREASANVFLQAAALTSASANP